MAKKKSSEIHSSIKLRLGYEADEADKDVLNDWKKRKKRVCKPCWELKYCPYGPLVEQSPLLPVVREESQRHIDYLKEVLRSDTMGEVRALDNKMRSIYQEYLNDEYLLLMQAIYEVEAEIKFEELNNSNDTFEEKLRKFYGGELPPIHIYRVPYEIISGKKIEESDFSPEIWQRVTAAREKLRNAYTEALRTNKIDTRKPLDAFRRTCFERDVNNFVAEDHPESIPNEFLETSCNVFGHVCLVYFAAEELTETSELRRIGRYKIPFHVQMRIVRRDNYTCQNCGEHLKDNEVEFDHIIPISKGGSSEEHNLRLTCYDCNRDKSDKYQP